MLDLTKQFEQLQKITLFLRFRFDRSSYVDALFQRIMFDTFVVQNFYNYFSEKYLITSKIELVQSVFDAYSKTHLVEYEKMYQSILSSPDVFFDFLKSAQDLGSIKKNQLKKIADLAYNGCDKNLEELEFCFYCYGLTINYIIHYCTLLKFGISPKDAILETCGLYIDLNCMKFSLLHEVFSTYGSSHFMKNKYVSIQSYLKPECIDYLNPKILLNMDDIEFISNEHLRFQNGMYLSGPHCVKEAGRIICLKPDYQKIYEDEIYFFSIQKQFDSTIVVKPKPLNIKFRSNELIYLQGVDFDKTTHEDCKDYGLAIHTKNNYIFKIIFMRLDTKVDYEYW